MGSGLVAMSGRLAVGLTAGLVPPAHPAGSRPALGGLPPRGDQRVSGLVQRHHPGEER